jgi:hypothetical protein
MLIAVSSFGESLRRVLLTAPAEAVFLMDSLPIRLCALHGARQRSKDLNPISKSCIKYGRMFLTLSAPRAYNLYTCIQASFIDIPGSLGTFEPPRDGPYGI